VTRVQNRRSARHLLWPNLWHYKGTLPTLMHSALWCRCLRQGALVLSAAELELQGAQGSSDAAAALAHPLLRSQTLLPGLLLRCALHIRYRMRRHRALRWGPRRALDRLKAPMAHEKQRVGATIHTHPYWCAAAAAAALRGGSWVGQNGQWPHLYMSVWAIDPSRCHPLSVCC